MTFKRIERGNGHSYTDDGAKIPGVTTILNAGMPKPGLIGWGAKAAGKYAVDHWDELLAMTPSERQDALVSAKDRTLRSAALRGQVIHRYGEALAKTGTAHGVPDELLAVVESYARWLDVWDVKTIATEASVINRTWKYAGTLDLIAEIDGRVWLLDLKSGDAWPEHALQLSAYANAQGMLAPDGTEVAMPSIERVGIVKVSADECELVPVDAGEQAFKAFTYIRRVAEYVWQTDRRTGRSPFGEPLQAPGGTSVTRAVSVGPAQ